MNDLYKRQLSLLLDILHVKDKTFLTAFAKGEPFWDIYKYSQFPAIRWKLLNIKRLKLFNFEKYSNQINLLEQLF